MSANPPPTPTFTIARALRVIAEDLSGDGAEVAASALVEAANRLVALERKTVTAKAGLRAILDEYPDVTDRGCSRIAVDGYLPVDSVAVFQRMADIAHETLKGVDEIGI